MPAAPVPAACMPAAPAPAATMPPLPVPAIAMPAAPLPAAAPAAPVPAGPAPAMALIPAPPRPASLAPAIPLPVLPAPPTPARLPATPTLPATGVPLPAGPGCTEFIIPLGLSLPQPTANTSAIGTSDARVHTEYERMKSSHDTNRFACTLSRFRTVGGRRDAGRHDWRSRLGEWRKLSEECTRAGAIPLEALPQPPSILEATVQARRIQDGGECTDRGFVDREPRADDLLFPRAELLVDGCFAEWTRDEAVDLRVVAGLPRL